MHLQHRVLTASLLGVVLTTLTGCAPGGTAAVSNSCSHSVDIYMDERSTSSVERDFDLDVYRESAHTKALESGTTKEFGLQPSNVGNTVMVIVYGADTAKVDYFGDQLTGSLDYTISGDMCLTPAGEE